MPISEDRPIKIVTAVGSLGYGYNPKHLFKGIQKGAEAIIGDAGSTDSGPQKLALGHTTVPFNSYSRDWKPILDACYHHKLKVLISSAGGDGSDEHVDMFVDICKEYCLEKGYKLKLVKIYGGIDKEVVREALNTGRIAPCGAVPELTHDDINQCPRIVAQMGVEPYLKAIKEHPDYDIIIAGRSYDPSPYAAYCIARGMKNVGNAFNMGKVMECGAFCSKPKSKEAFATVWEDRFNILPLTPTSVCTPESLVAHSLYENSHADIHPGPGGILDLTDSLYEGHDDRSCTASGAKFHVANPYTIKLEGAKATGYRSIWMGSFRDPILISQIDYFLNVLVRNRVKSLFPKDEYQLNFRVYGKDGTMGSYEPDPKLGKEIFLVGEVGAATQELADDIAAMGRTSSIHHPYPGQKGTGGNLAMPFTPLEVSMGQVCQFCVYHLMNVEDPAILFPYSAEYIGPSEAAVKRDPNFGFDAPGTGYHMENVPSAAERKAEEERLIAGVNRMLSSPNGDGESDGLIALPKLAEVLRSKNAGPYEISFDIIFYNMACLDRARKSRKLDKENISRLYNVPVEKIISCQFFQQAKAYKCTIPREGIAGSFGDRDLHASQQYVPILNLRV